jgi:hypothetical protein
MRRGAFTRSDLLVFLGLLAVGGGLLLCGCQSGNYNNARMQSQNNLKQMALALHNVASTYGGTQLPPSDGYIGSAKTGFTGTCFTHILPYIEADHLYKSITTTRNIIQNARGVPSAPSIDGVVVTSLKVRTYIAPADPSFVDGPVETDSGTTSYGSNAQAMGGNGISILEIIDGTSNTIAFAERYARPGLSRGKPSTNGPHYWVNQLGGWGTLIPDALPKYAGPAFGPTFYTVSGLPQIKPPVDEADERHANGPSAGTVQVAMFDGSVRSVGSGVSLETWKAAHTPNGKDELGSDW